MATNKFYAAFIKTTVYHEGDERSRTHPGHGYPAYTSEHTEVKKFKDDVELKNWVLYQEGKSTSYEIVLCTPVSVNRTITLDLSQAD